MKKDYIFNTIAGLLNAAEAVILSMIITRTTGLPDAGYVTIAFAVGNLLMTIGKYGVYSFQVTDHNGTYPFSAYLHTRIITISAMLVCLFGYLIYGHSILNYPTHKIFIVLFIGLIYAIEAFEDLIKAQCQHVGKLYIGAIMFIIRWIAIIISFGVSIIITNNASISLGISLVISVVIFALYYYSTASKISPLFSPKNNIGYPDKNRYTFIKKLLTTCFPLFLSSFLSFYIVNSSKYALEKCMDAQAQACFGFVAMPVFAIELLNSFIYQPQLVSLTDDYVGSNTTRFKARILKQYLIILLITIICLVVAYFIGIPFLTLLYHTNLNDYKRELLILLLGGGFLAVSGYQGAILTIIRHQRYLLWGYIPISILAFIFVHPIVKKYGTIGAAFSYLILIAMLCILYEIIIRKELVNVS